MLNRLFLRQYEVLPTDPLYLIDNRKTSNSAPYSESAMFKECEGSPEVTEEYESNGQTLDPIVLRYSHVKPDVYLQTQKSGNEPYGKHANRNKGVSLVRAGRELLLDDDWCNQTIDRWWGIEVNFKPRHDDLLVLVRINSRHGFIVMLLINIKDLSTMLWNGNLKRWFCRGLKLL